MWKLFQRNPKTYQIEHIIDYKATELKVHEFLFEHGKTMISNCIAKSNICTIIDGQNVKGDLYYLLNIRPNRNETATEFWANVMDRYFSPDGEVLIVNIGDYLYVADSFIKSNDVINYQTFSHVSISVDNHSIQLNRTFSARDSILIRRTDKKIDHYLEYVNDKITDIMIAIINAYYMKAPKSLLSIPAGFRMMEGDKVVSNDEFTKKISDDINSPQSKVIRIPDNLLLKKIETSSSVTSQEFKDIFNQAANNVAMALNIPINAFLGSITEKSDAIDELITFAVQIIVEQLNDALNHGLMEKETYLKNSRVFFDLSKSKHRDVISSSTSIDKLISVGFSFNQIMELFELPTIDEEWANQHHVTKNYASINEALEGGEIDGKE